MEFWNTIGTELDLRHRTRGPEVLSAHNMFLTLMILAASVTGLLMRLVLKADLVGIKTFIMGVVSLSPQSDMPASWVFVIHLLIVLVLVPALPTHIFTAPFTTIEARRREEERPLEDG